MPLTERLLSYRGRIDLLLAPSAEVASVSGLEPSRTTIIYHKNVTLSRDNMAQFLKIDEFHTGENRGKQENFCRHTSRKQVYRPKQ
jgi:hypothetical protein